MCVQLESILQTLVKHLAIEAQKLNINSNLEKELASASILYSCVFFIVVYSLYCVRILYIARHLFNL